MFSSFSDIVVLKIYMKHAVFVALDSHSSVLSNLPFHANDNTML